MSALDSAIAILYPSMMSSWRGSVSGIWPNEGPTVPLFPQTQFSPTPFPLPDQGCVLPVSTAQPGDTGFRSRFSRLSSRTDGARQSMWTKPFMWRKGRLCVALCATALLLLFHRSLPFRLPGLEALRDLAQSERIQAFLDGRRGIIHPHPMPLDGRKPHIPTYNLPRPPARFQHGVGGVMNAAPVPPDPQSFMWLIIILSDPALHDPDNGTHTLSKENAELVFGPAQGDAVEDRHVFRRKWPPRSPRPGISTRFALDLTSHEMGVSRPGELPRRGARMPDPKEVASFARNTERVALLKDEAAIHRDIIFLGRQDHVPAQFTYGDSRADQAGFLPSQTETVMALLRHVVEGRAGHPAVDVITVMDMASSKTFDLKKYWRELLVPKYSLRSKLYISKAVTEDSTSTLLTISWELANTVVKSYTSSRYAETRSPGSVSSHEHRPAVAGTEGLDEKMSEYGEKMLEQLEREAKHVSLERGTFDPGVIRQILREEHVEYLWVEADGKSS